MARYILPPEAFAAPYVTSALATLLGSLVDKRLGRLCLAPKMKRIRSPFDNRMVWVRPPLDKEVLAARISCEQQIMSDLATGILVAHVHSEATGQFRRIPPAFWNDRDTGLSFGALLQLKEGQLFPQELAGNNIYVTGEEAKAWLGMHGIGESDYFFPDELRSQRPKQHAPHRGRYNWPAFENQAVTRLHDEGGFFADWIQADLEKEMLTWCGLNWGREPSLRSAREHVTIALSRFHAEKRTIGLGNLGR